MDWEYGAPFRMRFRRNRIVLFRCQACRNSILYDDVYNVARIDGHSTHVAVLFRCSSCGRQGRAAATWDEWQDLEQRSFDWNKEKQLILDVALFDLELVNDLGDLELFWAAEPAPIEGRAERCGCNQCFEEDYGAENS